MLEGWTDFYFLIGSAAAGLIGLLFVVVTLTAGVKSPSSERGTKLYMTPTVFHFAAALSISAFCTSERVSAQTLSIIIGAVAFVGILYMGHRTLKLREPKAAPHWSDFWYYGVLPLVGYGCLAACAWAVDVSADWGAMTLACVILAFLLLGIRNAWDLVTWIAPRTEQLSKPDGAEGEPPG